MRHPAGQIASPLLAALAAACASTSNVPELATTYRSEVGRASRIQIENQIPRVLDRHSYEIERLEDDRRNTYRLQTRWKWREPFEDEAELGYVEASSRIIIEARLIADNTWRVRLRGETRLKRPDGTWETPEITEMGAAHFAAVADDLASEFRSRFR